MDDKQWRYSLATQESPSELFKTFISRYLDSETVGSFVVGGYLPIWSAGIDDILNCLGQVTA